MAAMAASELAHTLGADATQTPAFAGGATDTYHIGTGVSHPRDGVEPQGAGDRHEKPAGSRLRDPLGEGLVDTDAKRSRPSLTKVSISTPAAPARAAAHRTSVGEGAGARVPVGVGDGDDGGRSDAAVPGRVRPRAGSQLPAGPNYPRSPA